MSKKSTKKDKTTAKTKPTNNKFGKSNLTIERPLETSNNNDNMELSQSQRGGSINPYTNESSAKSFSMGDWNINKLLGSSRFQHLLTQAGVSSETFTNTRISTGLEDHRPQLLPQITGAQDSDTSSVSQPSLSQTVVIQQNNINLQIGADREEVKKIKKTTKEQSKELNQQSKKLNEVAAQVKQLETQQESTVEQLHKQIAKLQQQVQQLQQQQQGQPQQKSKSYNLPDKPIETTASSLLDEEKKEDTSERTTQQELNRQKEVKRKLLERESQQVAKKEEEEKKEEKSKENNTEKSKLFTIEEAWKNQINSSINHHKKWAEQHEEKQDDATSVNPSPSISESTMILYNMIHKQAWNDVDLWLRSKQDELNWNQTDNIGNNSIMAAYIPMYDYNIFKGYRSTIIKNIGLDTVEKTEQIISTTKQITTNLSANSGVSAFKCIEEMIKIALSYSTTMWEQQNVRGEGILHMMLQTGHDSEESMSRIAKIMQRSKSNPINLPDIQGVSPLTLALMNDNDPDIVGMIVANGGNINHPNQYGYTPLHILCAEMNVNAVKYAIALRANMQHSAPPHQNTPLHTLFDVMVDHRYNPNGHKIVNTFFKNGYRIHINNSGNSELNLINLYKTVEQYKQVYDKAKTAWNEFLYTQQKVNELCKNVDSPHYFIPTMQKILNNNLKDPGECSATLIKLQPLLLNNSMVTPAVSAVTKMFKEAAKIYAQPHLALKQYWEAFEVYLDYGLPNIASNKGWGPLHFAVLANNAGISEFLITNNASCISMTKTIPAKSPVMMAVANGNIAIAKACLDTKTVNVNYQHHGDGGKSLLHYAVTNTTNPNSAVKTIELLIQHQANPNIQNTKGNTAMHLVAMKLDLSLMQKIKLLQALSASDTYLNLELKNVHHNTPWDILGAINGIESIETVQAVLSGDTGQYGDYQ